jgi:hypothetical protein
MNIRIWMLNHWRLYKLNFEMHLLDHCAELGLFSQEFKLYHDIFK